MGDAARLLVQRSQDVEIVRVVSLGWYDGPRQGFIRLNRPRPMWYFTWRAEVSSSGEVDDRLYALAALPADGE